MRDDFSSVKVHVHAFLLLVILLVLESSTRMEREFEQASFDGVPTRRQKRRQRAVERGYVTAAPKGCSLLSVPNSIFARVKDQRDALILHENCNKLLAANADQPKHWLADAVLSTARHRGREATRAGQLLNRRAARSRHDWEEVQSDERSSGTSQASDVPVLLLDDLLDEPLDLFQLHARFFNFLYGSQWVATDVDEDASCDVVDEEVGSVASCGISIEASESAGLPLLADFTLEENAIMDAFLQSVIGSDDAQLHYINDDLHTSVDLADVSIGIGDTLDDAGSLHGKDVPKDLRHLAWADVCSSGSESDDADFMLDASLHSDCGDGSSLVSAPMREVPKELHVSHSSWCLLEGRWWKDPSPDSGVVHVDEVGLEALHSGSLDTASLAAGSGSNSALAEESAGLEPLPLAEVSACDPSLDSGVVHVDEVEDPAGHEPVTEALHSGSFDTARLGSGCFSALAEESASDPSLDSGVVHVDGVEIDAVHSGSYDSARLAVESGSNGPEALAEDSALVLTDASAPDVLSGASVVKEMVVPFFIPCEFVSASISRAAAKSMSRSLLDGLYSSRACLEQVQHTQLWHARAHEALGTLQKVQKQSKQTFEAWTQGFKESFAEQLQAERDELQQCMDGLRQSHCQEFEDWTKGFMESYEERHAEMKAAHLEELQSARAEADNLKLLNYRLLEKLRSKTECDKDDDPLDQCMTVHDKIDSTKESEVLHVNCSAECCSAGQLDTFLHDSGSVLQDTFEHMHDFEQLREVFAHVPGLGSAASPSHSLALGAERQQTCHAGSELGFAASPSVSSALGVGRQQSCHAGFKEQSQSRMKKYKFTFSQLDSLKASVVSANAVDSSDLIAAGPPVG